MSTGHFPFRRLSAADPYFAPAVLPPYISQHFPDCTNGTLASFSTPPALEHQNISSQENNVCPPGRNQKEIICSTEGLFVSVENLVPEYPAKYLVSVREHPPKLMGSMFDYRVRIPTWSVPLIASLKGCLTTVFFLPLISHHRRTKLLSGSCAWRENSHWQTIYPGMWTSGRIFPLAQRTASRNSSAGNSPRILSHIIQMPRKAAAMGCIRLSLVLHTASPPVSQRSIRNYRHLFPE